MVDIVELLSQHTEQVDVARFWDRASAAGLESALVDRLVEVNEMVADGEVDAIWWDRLGLMLEEGKRQAVLKVIYKLQDYQRAL